jgi:hypothetical protein
MNYPPQAGSVYNEAIFSLRYEICTIAVMRLKQSSRKEKQRDITHQTWAVSAEALALREVYPAEEFAGFENFGEFPEWHPGQAEHEITSGKMSNERKI